METFIGYTGGLSRTGGGTQQSSSIYKHYHTKHGKVPEEPLGQFCVLKKCTNKTKGLLQDILFITKRNPSLTLQSD